MHDAIPGFHVSIVRITRVAAGADDQVVDLGGSGFPIVPVVNAHVVVADIALFVDHPSVKVGQGISPVSLRGDCHDLIISQHSTHAVVEYLSLSKGRIHSLIISHEGAFRQYPRSRRE